MEKLFSLILIVLGIILIPSCTQDPVPGCTDPAANNFNSLATTDNGTCDYFQQTNLTTGGYVQCLASIGDSIIAGLNGGGILFSDDNGNTWTELINNNGTVVNTVWSLAINGSNIYAGAETGLFQSTNYGSTWSWILNGLPNGGLQSVSIDGNNIYAGTWGSGVFISTNNGNTWNALNSGSPNIYVLSMAISGSNVFVGTETGLFLSNSVGSSLLPINTGFPNSNTWIQSLAITGNNIFAGTIGNGIYLSTNNGNNWTAMNNGLPSNIYIYTIAINGINIFIGTDNGVFQSNDNGNSWSLLGLSGKPIVSLLINNNNIFAGTSGGLWVLPLP